MTPYQREILIRTIMGEAANQGPEGWAAVAHVIRNRTIDPRWPGDPVKVALQPKQFSAWNDKNMGGNDLVRRSTDHPAFQKIGAVVDQVFAGQVPDPTQGATHYYAPAGMPGRRQPKWFPKVTQERGAPPATIGGHIFTGKVKGSTLPSPEDPVSFPPRRPHSQTPGIEAPQYEPDSPYYRPPAPQQTPAVPVPQPKPQQGFDWQNAIGSAGNLLNALSGQGQQQNAQALQAAQRQAMLDEAERRRKAWDQSFTWF